MPSDRGYIGRPTFVGRPTIAAPQGRPLINQPRIFTGPPITRGPEVGTCLTCEELFYGPEAVRLMYGQIFYPREAPEEPHFKSLEYPDHTRVKWLCLDCAEEHYILGGERIFELSSRLDKMQLGWCCICAEPIEPVQYQDDNWSSAIKLELGHLSLASKGSFYQFHPTREGHLHWFCMEQLELDMQALVPDDDAPPTEEDWLCE